MSQVTISSRFQVVIPQHIRERLALQPGQKIQALLYDNRIEFIPTRSARTMRGFLKGIETTFDRRDEVWTRADDNRDLPDVKFFSSKKRPKTFFTE